MILKHLKGAVLALMVAGPAFAHGFKGGDLEIGHPFIPTPPAVAKTAGGYLKITNTGTEADRLLAVEAEISGKAEVHTTEVDTAGVARMIHIPELVIPPGETVVLERGGYHVMFMGLTRELKEGDLIPATLVFERAGRIGVEFSIDAPKEAEADHSGH